MVACLEACDELCICYLCKLARPMIVHLFVFSARASWHDSCYHYVRLRQPLPQEAYDCQQPAPTCLAWQFLGFELG